MILTPPPTGGQQILRHALARRWTSIVAGTVAGLVLGVVAGVGAPAPPTAPGWVSLTAPTKKTPPFGVIFYF